MLDPYVYSGTNILKNKENIKDYEKLNIFERTATANRERELKSKGVKGNFDFNHLKKIHKYIFKMYMIGLVK